MKQFHLRMCFVVALAASLAVACGKSGGDDLPQGTPVAEVILNKTTLELYEGDTYQLVATIEPEDATDKSLSWSSSQTDIASVDNDGKVTALKEGETVITATSSNDIKASCSVTVELPLTDDADITAKFNADFAKALQTKGCIKDATKITYGEVKAIKNVDVSDCSLSSLQGLKFFTALEKLWASNNDISEIDVSHCPELYYLGVMDCKNLTSLDVSNNHKLYNLACNNSPIATLDLSYNSELGNLYVQDCRLTSLDFSKTKVYTTAKYSGNPGKDGWFAITYPEDGYAYNYLADTWTFEEKTVTPIFRRPNDPDATSISFKSGSETVTEIVMVQSEQSVVKTVFEPENAAFQYVEWSSDNEKVATVSRSDVDKHITGCITAIGKGTATITAKAAVSGVVGKIKVTVTEKPNYVAFDGHSGEDDQAEFLTWFGKEFDLKAQIEPSDLPLTLLQWNWNDPNKNKADHGVEYNVTADKATVSSYWTENTTQAGIDVRVMSKWDESKTAYANVIFRTVGWIEYKNEKGELRSSHAFTYVGGGTLNWKCIWRSDLKPEVYFAAYCPPREYSDLVIASEYYPDAYIPTSEYTLTVSEDDAKAVKITKMENKKHYKLESITTKTTSVELIYTCGKHVQRYTLDIIK